MRRSRSRKGFGRICSGSKEYSRLTRLLYGLHHDDQVHETEHCIVLLLFLRILGRTSRLRLLQVRRHFPLLFGSPTGMAELYVPHSVPTLHMAKHA